MDREALWATVHGVVKVRHDLATKPPPPLQDHTNIQFLFKLPYTDCSIHWTITYYNHHSSGGSGWDWLCRARRPGLWHQHLRHSCLGQRETTWGNRATEHSLPCPSHGYVWFPTEHSWRGRFSAEIFRDMHRKLCCTGGWMIKWSPAVRREAPSFLHGTQKRGRQRTRNHKDLSSRRIMFFPRAGVNNSPWGNHLQWCCQSQRKEWSFTDEVDDFSFPGGSDSKESVCNAGDPGSIPGLGRSPKKGNGYPLRDSCLENSTDRGTWLAIDHRVANSQTQLSN